MLTRKCSLCGEIKPENEFRFMHKQNRHNAYCKKCESWYNKLYKKSLRELKKGGTE